MTSVIAAISGGVAAALDASLSKTPSSRADSPTNARIGDRLRLIRKSHGISETELSAKLGIDCNNLKQYESGERRVGASLLLRIAKLLDIRPEYFFQEYPKQSP